MMTAKCKCSGVGRATVQEEDLHTTPHDPKSIHTDQTPEAIPTSHGTDEVTALPLIADDLGAVVDIRTEQDHHQEDTLQDVMTD